MSGRAATPPASVHGEARCRGVRPTPFGLWGLARRAPPASTSAKRRGHSTPTADQAAADLRGLGLAVELARGAQRGGARVAERGRRREVGREAAVDDALGLLASARPEPGDALAGGAVHPALGHQVEGLVGDAAVVVDAAVVGRAPVALRVVVGVAGPERRRAVEARVLHRAHRRAARVEAVGEVLAQRVVREQASRPRGLLEELGRRAHDVGEGLVERARLALVDAVPGVVGDAVGELVRDHVERAREGRELGVAVAVEHHVRERVVGRVRELEGRRQRVDHAAHGQVGVVEAAPPVALEEVVVGPAGVDVGVHHRAVVPACCRRPTRSRPGRSGRWRAPSR